MGTAAKTKDVKGAEAILHSIIGIVLIIFFSRIGGIFRWVFGLIGVAFIVAAILGYRHWKGFMLKTVSKQPQKQ